MSYEILYDKQFVRIPQKGEDKFIPMIYAGSNNCFQFDRSNRGRRARSWWSFTWLLGDESENHFATEDKMIKKLEDWRNSIIKDNVERNKRNIEKGDESWNDTYNDNTFGYFSSLQIGSSTRTTTFRQVKGIVTTGVRKSLTIEELAEEGIFLTVNSLNSYYDEKRVKELGLPAYSNTVNTTEQLLEALKELEKYQEAGAGIHFHLNASENNMKWLRRKRFPRKKKIRELIEVDSYYTIKMANGGYLTRKLKYGYRYAGYPYLKYQTEAQAKQRAKSSGGIVEKIEETTKLYTS